MKILLRKCFDFFVLILSFWTDTEGKHQSSPKANVKPPNCIWVSRCFWFLIWFWAFAVAVFSVVSWFQRKMETLRAIYENGIWLYLIISVLWALGQAFFFSFLVSFEAAGLGSPQLQRTLESVSSIITVCVDATALRNRCNLCRNGQADQP